MAVATVTVVVPVFAAFVVLDNARKVASGVARKQDKVWHGRNKPKFDSIVGKEYRQLDQEQRRLKYCGPLG